MNIKILIRVLMISSLIASCTKKKDDDSADTTNFTTDTIAKISTVSSDFAPGSLDAGASGSSVETFNSNPCTGTNGLIDCQPNLLKLYLSVSKQQLDMLTTIVSSVGSQLGHLADGASGSTSGDSLNIQYSKTDSDTWSLTLVNASTSQTAAYISVDGGLYTLELNFANMPAEPNTPTQGSYSSVISYTDANTWSITSTMLDSECQSDDVRAPQNVSIVMSKADGLWKGKAMLYHPRWASFSPDPTCSTTPTDAIGLNMYSDFVGDGTVAKMNVYMLKRTRAANEITSHPLSDICTEYPSICSSGNIGSETPTSYPNSVCVEASTGDSNWNSSCSSISGGAAVSSASFGASSDWVAPSSFYNMSITVGP